MTTVDTLAGTDTDRIVLHDVPWSVYVDLRDNDANRHVRMSYYRGGLELMSPRYRHEKYGRRLERLVSVLAEELNIAGTCAGSTTFRRECEEAGKEPDTCFYFVNEPRIRDKDDIDLADDPPPDLAIEVDDSRNSERKLPIYAALGVPEVWRYDAQNSVLWIGVLQPDGTYLSTTRSACLSLLTPERIVDALNLCRGIPESHWGRLLRDWARRLAEESRQ
jgi:Uma2 family endonuclease